MVHLRAMKEEDLAAVLAIADSLASAPHWAIEAYTKAIEPGSVPQRIALVAEVDGGVAGFAVAQIVQGTAELETICVEGLAQGKGLGRELLGELMIAAKARDAEEMTLEVRASNERAVALYKGMGFRERGRRRKYYQHPVDDAVVMGMEL